MTPRLVLRLGAIAMTLVGVFAIPALAREISEHPAAAPMDSTWQWESAGGWTGTWIRRGTSNVFDVVYRGPGGQQVTAVEEMTIDGTRAHGRRLSSADNVLCNLEGTIQPDGRVIQGTGACPGVNSGWWWRITLPAGGAGGQGAQPPATPARSLTGAWVHSAASSTQTPDSKVIIVQDGTQVTLTQSYKSEGTQGHWVTLVCVGPLSNGEVRLRCDWSPGGNPLGFGGDFLILARLSADGNHLDGTLQSGSGSQETHYSRIP